MINIKEKVNQNINLFLDISGDMIIMNINKPYGGNYWDTWTEPDENDDGFVDIPYSIEGGNEDKLPWTKPDAWRDIK